MKEIFGGFLLMPFFPDGTKGIKSPDYRVKSRFACTSWPK